MPPGAGQEPARLPASAFPRVLSRPGDINRLLNGVLSYQRTVEGQLRDCRFDYRFLYRTSDDYMRGREKFERYFYPARVQHVAGAGGR